MQITHELFDLRFVGALRPHALGNRRQLGLLIDQSAVGLLLVLRPGERIVNGFTTHLHHHPHYLNNSDTKRIKKKNRSAIEE